MDLCEQRQDFRFSVDSVWALDQMTARCPSVRERVSELANRGALTFGLAWSGVEWIPHPECFVRDLQVGALTLKDFGLTSCSLAVRSSAYGHFKGIVRQAGVDQLVLVAGVELGVCDLPVLDLSSFGDLALRAAGKDPLGQRDAEKKLAITQDAIPAGEELWCPTVTLLDDLAAWAEDASLPLCYATWDGQATESHTSLEKADASFKSYREALQPGIHADLTRVSAELLRAERILSIATLLGDDVSKCRPEIEALWKRHLEDLSGTYVGSGDQVKQDALTTSCEELQSSTKRLQTDVEYEIASSVDFGQGPDGIVSIVVFNPSARDRSEAVEANVIYYGANRATEFDRYEFYRLVDSEGNVVPSEEIGGKQAETAEIKIRFVACDVPASGYKTYYLVPKPRVTSGQPTPVSIQAPGGMVPDFPEPSFAIDDVEERISEPRRGLRLGRTFQVGAITLAVDDVTGQIDLSDRRRGMKLVEGLRVEGREDSLKSGPGTFDPTGRIFPYSVDRIDLIESGEVSAQLLVSGRIASSKVELRLRLFAELPFVDIDVSVEWKEQLPMLLELCAPLSGALGGGSYDLPFASKKWEVSDFEVVADRWVTAKCESAGICFSSERTSLIVSGSEIRSPLLLSSPDPASYAYNKVWMSYPVRVNYGFRFFLGKPPDRVLVDEWVECFSAQCIYDRATPRTRPASESVFRVASDNVCVSSLRPVEGGVEARVFDSVGEGCEADLEVGKTAARLEVIDLHGRTIEVIDRSVSFSPGEIKSLRFACGPERNE